MNKRYIDFVPSKNATRGTSGKRSATGSTAVPRSTSNSSVVARRTNATTGVNKVTKTVATPTRRTVTRATNKPTKRAVSAPRISAKVSPRATGTTVMSVPRATRGMSSANEIRQIKSQKVIGSKKKLLASRKSTNKATTTKTAVKVTDGKDKGVFTPPRPTFINQNKVVKRPLSGNIYRKKVEKAVEEKPHGPVTIISKPEKDRHVGVIVTIIITIILGAAAGTVAFLLLPK